jgi:hypothetical protein
MNRGGEEGDVDELGWIAELLNWDGRYRLRLAPVKQ